MVGVPAGTFDAFLIALNEGLLLITDDIFVRHLALSVGHQKACWLQAVLLAARERGRMTPEKFVRGAACLVGFGQFYIGVGPHDLLEAAALPDGLDPGAGPFAILCSVLGGKTADLASHVSVANAFLRLAWRIPMPWHSYPDLGDRRRLASSILLRNLLRNRQDDCGLIMHALITHAVWNPALQRFLREWAQGHFVPLAPSILEGPAASVARPSNKRRR